MSNNSSNFLTLNSVSVERLQDEDVPAGYDYNRLVDALDGFRTGVVSLVNPILTVVNQSVVTATRVYEQSVDASFPFLVDFVLPVGFQAVTATISWKARNFRYTPTGSGGGTTSTDATGESGHSHSHSHTSAAHAHNLSIGTTANATNHTIVVQTIAGTDQPPIQVFNGTGTITDTQTVQSTTPGGTGSDATGSSGHTHSHNHTFAGISFSYSEGTASTVDALLIDGVNKTTALTPIGPWATDQVLINLLSVFPAGDGAWHTIQLNAHAQGRFVVELTFGG